MKKLDEAIGRKTSSNTSPKAVVRQIAKTKSEKMTINQCQRLLFAVAAAMDSMITVETKK
jgi:ribosome maturation factor RimP